MLTIATPTVIVSPTAGDGSVCGRAVSISVTRTWEVSNAYIDSVGRSPGSAGVTSICLIAGSLRRVPRRTILARAVRSSIV